MPSVHFTLNVEIAQTEPWNGSLWKRGNLSPATATGRISPLFCCCGSSWGVRELTFAQESLLLTPERHRRSPSERKRLINAPLTGLGLKRTHTYTTLDAPACARARLCRYNTLHVISAQPPVYMKGDNKRHMNSNKAQPQSINTSSLQSQRCNLNPLFKSSVCEGGVHVRAHTQRNQIKF